MPTLRSPGPALAACTIAHASSLAATVLAVVGLSAAAGAQSRQVWFRTYAGPALGEDVARDVVLGHHGVMFVIGSSSNGPNSDALVLAYDGIGTRLWEQRIDLGGHETGDRIVFDTATGALFALGNRATFAGSGAASFAL